MRKIITFLFGQIPNIIIHNVVYLDQYHRCCLILITTKMFPNFFYLKLLDYNQVTSDYDALDPANILDERSATVCKICLVRALIKY